MEVANTLAYLDTATITAVKSFIVQAPSGNFTNILQAAFSYERFRTAFMCLQFGFVIFWQKDFGAKAAYIMLVKLTPGGTMGPSREH
jgi:hypothetical protein